jgi:hypothetical protein
MVTVEELCAEMGRTGRHLTPRAARDWWTKGLLPRPQRRGLGRGMGTETFWASGAILEQARAADDLLTRGSPAFIAPIGLWLWGFPVDLRLVRASYLKLIDQRSPWAHRPTKLVEPEDAVGELAAKLAPALLRRGSPPDVRDSAVDLLLEILAIFYGADDDPMIDGLANLLTKVSPFLRATMKAQSGCNEALDSFVGEYFEPLLEHLQRFGALPRQREAVDTATAYELTRARRIVRLAFGSVMRLAPSAQSEEVSDWSRPSVLIFGRPAVPILVGVLREPLGRRIIPDLLRLAVMTRRASKDVCFRP